MAWNAVTDVNDGQSFGGAAWQSAIDAIAQLQAALGPDVPTAVTFTPTWVNVTLGTGPTNLGSACRIGDLAIVTVGLTLGTGGALTGAPSITNLPFTALAGGPAAVASVFYVDSGVRVWNGTAQVAAGTTILDTFNHTESGNSGSVNATNPFTFGVADRIQATVTYLT